MSEVIRFPVVDRVSAADDGDVDGGVGIAWLCGACSGYEWMLLPDGVIECCDCGSESSNMRWFLFNEPEGAA